MSPRSPPRGPALPRPRSVMYCPVATPAGTRIVTVFSARTRPSPRHFLHGVETTVPSPPQVGHGATLTNWPKNERCARRTSPLPPQVAQRWGVVPGSAPLPLHLSHASSSLSVSVLSIPDATSASVRLI